MAERPKKYCPECKKDLPITKFYVSKNPLSYDGLSNVCKNHVRAKVNIDDMNTVYDVLQSLNIPFLKTYWEKAKEHKDNIFGEYMRMINSLKQLNNYTWKDSDFGEEKDTITDVPKEIVEKTVIEEVSGLLTEEYIDEENDKKNRDDVIRLLGYDPFEKENPNDKRYLYNTLIDYLDEATLEDSFKLPTVIEIVKSFNQVEKINQGLTILTSDITNLSSNGASVKSLMSAKTEMLRAILALAKDNGISVNNNNNKSKGGNTLSGIVKKLDEIGLESAELNLFNIETAQAMKQVADISHKSIIEQLMLNESDYTEMIAKQKDMLRDLNEKVMNLEEENRLLKIKIKRQEKNNISERG